MSHLSMPAHVHDLSNTVQINGQGELVDLEWPGHAGVKDHLMGMTAYYLQITPGQVEAVRSSQVLIDHDTFMTAKTFVRVPPPLISPNLALAAAVIVGSLFIWFAWLRHLQERWRRWRLSLALVAAALMVVVIGFRQPTPPTVFDAPVVSKPLRIDRSWHGIHFLLTGSAWDGTPPLSNVVLGGTKTGQDLGYGPARYLTPDEVKEVAAALDEITIDALRARFDPKAMTKAQIYSWHEDEGEEGLNYFLHYYGEVRAYFHDAARKGNGMLLCVM